MRYIFYIALFALGSFATGTASATDAVAAGEAGAMVPFKPSSALQPWGHHGGVLAPYARRQAVRTQAMSREELFSGNEFRIAQGIVLNKVAQDVTNNNIIEIENYVPAKYMPEGADYANLLLKLAAQADKGHVSARELSRNPELLQLFFNQYINGCFILNLPPDISNKQFMAKIFSTVMKQEAGGMPESEKRRFTDLLKNTKILEEHDRRETAAFVKDAIEKIDSIRGSDKPNWLEWDGAHFMGMRGIKERLKNLGSGGMLGFIKELRSKINNDLEESRQDFISSPYDKLYSAFGVAYTALSEGDILRAPRSWAFFLPALRQELDYLQTNLRQDGNMKPYIYYVTKLIQQIASGTHDKINVNGPAMGTTEESHRQFLKTLIESGSATYKLRLSHAQSGGSSKRQSQKIQDSFEGVLYSQLKEFFPHNPQEYRKDRNIVFNHHLNAFIIFALGAYETYTSALREHNVPLPIKNKYKIINDMIGKAIKKLNSDIEYEKEARKAREDELKRQERARHYGREQEKSIDYVYKAKVTILQNFEVPTLSDSITTDLLDKITARLTPHLVRAVDKRYVIPILEEEREPVYTDEVVVQQREESVRSEHTDTASPSTPGATGIPATPATAPTMAPPPPIAPAAPPAPMAPAVPVAPQTAPGIPTPPTFMPPVPGAPIAPGLDLSGLAAQAGKLNKTGGPQPRQAFSSDRSGIAAQAAQAAKSGGLKKAGPQQRPAASANPFLAELVTKAQSKIIERAGKPEITIPQVKTGAVAHEPGSLVSIMSNLRVQVAGNGDDEEDVSDKEDWD